MGQPARPVPSVRNFSENVVDAQENYLSNFPWGRWRVVVFAPDLPQIYIAEDSTSANGTHDTSIAVLRDISENS